MDISSIDQNKLDAALLPTHVAIIMDGNGRWAQQRNLPRSAGHKEGAKNFKRIVKYCNRRGIKYLTVYAFSTENWKRPKLEVKTLFMLFKQYLREALLEFKAENISIHFLGEVDAFPKDLSELINDTAVSSSHQTGMVLNLAMNYGGRSEIVRAVRNISNEVQKGSIKIEDIDEQLVSQYLYTSGQPDPDLIIRPSGELRTSNFLLWQSAYSEYVFMDNVMWPDFTPEYLEAAFEEYAKRNRRFGGV